MNLFFLKTDISMLLAEAFQALERYAEEKQIRYELSLPAVQLMACVDREALRKLFYVSIYDNIEAASKCVTVKLLPLESDEALFMVEFSNDDQLSALTPFQDMANNGIKSIAAVWTDTLPARDEAAGSLAIRERGRKATAVDQTKPVVLLVEDNKEILAYLNKELKQHYNVLRASTATEAIRLLARDSVQLVLAAAGMPMMDGLTLCKHIKSNRLYSHIPVVLLTDPAVPENKVQGLLSGADTYIEKPIAMPLLTLQMANLLKSRQLVHAYVTDTLRMDAVTAQSKTEDSFLANLQGLINDNISEMDLSVDILAQLMNMSRPTLYRKVKQYTNSTPNELISMAKLKRAAELLSSKKYNITQIAAMVGYTAQSNFSRDFQKRFGAPPSIYSVQLSKQSGVA